MLHMLSAALRRLAAPVIALALLTTPAVQPAAQQAQRLTGRVVDATTSTPLQGARVQVVGTSLVAGTSADGRYTFPSVPAGRYEVRVTIIGYAAAKQSVTIGDAPATLDFALQTAAVQIDAVITTATGQQRALEVGNAVSRIDAAKIAENQAVASMGHLLVAKTPGVQVLGGNVTGGSQRIRIRGISSLSLNSDPIVFVDGIRVTSDQQSISGAVFTGGQQPGRLNDINPDDIESIEVVRGPSAATLYGTEAANGVIVITTKRGKAGPSRWNVYAEQRFIEDNNPYPDAYRAWRTGPTAATTSSPTNAIQCSNTQTVAVGSTPALCRQDSVTRFNVLADPTASPIDRGFGRQYGLSVSGGTEAAQYFVQGEFEDEVGVWKMPDTFQRVLRNTRRVDVLPYVQVRPNQLRRVNLRANVNAIVSPKMDVGVQSSFVTSTQSFPQSDNNINGLLGNALGGPGFRGNGRVGYRSFTPDQSFSNTVTSDVNRFIGGITGNYRPTSWLRATMIGGIDYTGRNESQLCRVQQCAPVNADYLSGFKENARTEIFQYTADGRATTTFRPLQAIELRTTGGVQWVYRNFERNGASGVGLPPGATQVSDASLQTGTEILDASRTLGFYVEQMVGWRDRLFVTGAVRSDKNSAFGGQLERVFYPRLSASYVLSDEEFFPRSRFLNSVRLRSAFGAAGQQPGVNDALRFYAGTAVAPEQGDVVGGLVFAAVGNNELRPEYTREVEFGGDLGLLDNRVQFEATYYNKRSKDALLAQTVAPSVGAAVTRFVNIGAITNSGFEMLLNARLLERRAFGWDITLNGSTNRNKILSLGGLPDIIGTVISQREGYPIDSYWLRPYTYNDADANGIITRNEVTVEDSARFIGPQTPIHEFAFINNFTLFRSLRLSVMTDYKGGHYVSNGTERIRCNVRNNCRGAFDPTAPLWEQARAVALRETPSQTQFGFVEKGDFIRLRELSVGYDIPASFLRFVNARNVSVVFAARNLWVSTDYTGIDPEANYFEGTRGTSSDFQTAGPPTYYTFRLNLGF